MCSAKHLLVHTNQEERVKDRPHVLAKAFYYRKRNKKMKGAVSKERFVEGPTTLFVNKCPACS